MYNNMNTNKNMELQIQESLKRRWHDSLYTRLLTTQPPHPPPKPPHFLHSGRLDCGGGGDLVLNVVPSITVALEGRSICHRINLQHHANYQSLAKALRHMFINMVDIQQKDDENEVQQLQQLNLSNALPGYLVAYEDMENDLLLAGDLKWKDFVRVAKRIRIMPVKSSSRKQKITKHFPDFEGNARVIGIFC